jgi:hypothetical protein
MDKNFKNEDPKKDMGFILSLGAILLFSLMGIGIDTDEFLQRVELHIPSHYFFLIFGVDFLMFLGIVLIFFYRKVGIFLFPVAVLTHYILHSYYLNTFLYTDVTNLFLFISVGLFAFIPKWQFFK